MFFCIDFRFLVTDPELDVLFQQFCKIDVEGSGFITKQDFFDKVVHIKRNLLGEALLEFCDVSDGLETISYNQFVYVVTTYALFEPDDMLRFCFQIFDREKKGFIDIIEREADEYFCC